MKKKKDQSQNERKLVDLLFYLKIYSYTHLFYICNAYVWFKFAHTYTHSLENENESDGIYQYKKKQGIQ